jgi:hypothetical protein
MSDLDWMIGIRFRLLERLEYGWAFDFYQDASLVAHCLWRLVEDGRIRRTSKDDGHQFGLPAEVELAAEINSRLASTAITGIKLWEGTLDLTIRFETNHAVQIIPDSGGYESWHVCGNSREYIAQGGGNLVVLQSRC